jgi:hypothetical protein
MDGAKIRGVLLEVVAALDAQQQSPMQRGALQQVRVLRDAKEKLGLVPSKGPEARALLTAWHDLFRAGHLAWGDDLDNPDAPFCHLTEQGRRTLQHLSRDPANPDGYRAYLQAAGLNPIADAYVDEGLDAYNANCFRAAAVMVGAATESLVLELRDQIVSKVAARGGRPARDLSDFKIKRVLDALQREFQMKGADMPPQLAEDVGAYWPAFTQQIRSARNEAGHPVSLSSMTPERVHAALLVFPEVAKMTATLRDWIGKQVW